MPRSKTPPIKTVESLSKELTAMAKDFDKARARERETYAILRRIATRLGFPEQMGYEPGIIGLATEIENDLSPILALREAALAIKSHD